MEVAKPKTKMTQPNDKTIQLNTEEQASSVCQNVLEETLRQGALRLLAQTIRIEFRYGPAPLAPNQRVRLA